VVVGHKKKFFLKNRKKSFKFKAKYSKSLKESKIKKKNDIRFFFKATHNNKKKDLKVTKRNGHSLTHYICLELQLSSQIDPILTIYSF